MPSALHDKYSKLLVACSGPSALHAPLVHQRYVKYIRSTRRTAFANAFRNPWKCITRFEFPTWCFPLLGISVPLCMWCIHSTESFANKSHLWSSWKKRLQRKMEKYDRELNEQISAIHRGTCGREDIAAELEESGYACFIAQVENPASVLLSAIPKLQVFLRD